MSNDSSCIFCSIYLNSDIAVVNVDGCFVVIVNHTNQSGRVITITGHGSCCPEILNGRIPYYTEWSCSHNITFYIDIQRMSLSVESTCEWYFP